MDLRSEIEKEFHNFVKHLLIYLETRPLNKETRFEITEGLHEIDRRFVRRQYGCRYHVEMCLCDRGERRTVAYHMEYKKKKKV